MMNKFKKIGIGALVTSVLALGGVSTGFAAGDAVKGEKVFKRCKACHQIGVDAKNKVGPTLNGVIGRPAGVVVGFKYGKGIETARGEIGDDADGDGYLDKPEGFEGLVWTEEALLGYLENPKKYISDYIGKSAQVRMALRLKKEDQRADVIAYLKKIGLDGNPAQ